MGWLKSKWFWALVLLAAGGSGWAIWSGDEEPPPDRRFTGAYRLADGRLASITPITDQRVRMRIFEDGSTRQFYMGEGTRFETSPGFSTAAERDGSGAFAMDAEGSPTGFQVDGANGPMLSAQRIPLEQRIVHFQSGELTLRGKLVLPEGPGPHPVVILVHGSEAYSAVDYYFMPYMLANHGFAVMAYDKRGTGGSTGEYTQHFHWLAGDAAAAARWLKEQPEIDGERINLMGFSQGGWISPLAAQQIEGMRAISIHYGVAVPVTREDRWGYVYQLQQKGFGPDAVAKADEINVYIEEIIDKGNSEAWSDLKRLVDQYEDEDWYQAIAGSDSILGRVAETKVPLTAWQIYLWFRGRNPSTRTYVPEPTLRDLDIPQHWILAGEDSSAPTPESVAVLEKLRGEGKPIDILVYDTAEHGIIEFQEDAEGNRTLMGYSETYLRSAVEWLMKHNGLKDV